MSERPINAAWLAALAEEAESGPCFAEVVAGPSLRPLLVIGTPEAAAVAFAVYELQGQRPDGTPLFDYVGGGLTSNPACVERFLTGRIRRDGASDWDFDPDRAGRHFGSRRMAVAVGELLGRLHDLAEARLAAPAAEAGLLTPQRCAA